jgi:hypothetical protein
MIASFIRRNRSKLSAGLLLATLVGAGGLQAYEHFTGSCCHAGAACCHPGSPCCHGRQMAEL